MQNPRGKSLEKITYTLSEKIKKITYTFVWVIYRTFYNIYKVCVDKVCFSKIYIHTQLIIYLKLFDFLSDNKSKKLTRPIWLKIKISVVCGYEIRILTTVILFLFFFLISLSCLVFSTFGYGSWCCCYQSFPWPSSRSWSLSRTSQQQPTCYLLWESWAPTNTCFSIWRIPPIFPPPPQSKSSLCSSGPPFSPLKESASLVFIHFHLFQFQLVLIFWIKRVRETSYNKQIGRIYYKIVFCNSWTVNAIFLFFFSMPNHKLQSFLSRLPIFNYSALFIKRKFFASLKADFHWEYFCSRMKKQKKKTRGKK